MLPWLARLDARAKQWPRPAYWSYVALKWYLVAAGCVIAVGLAWQGNPLGLGLVAAATLGLVKGILTGLSARRSM